VHPSGCQVGRGPSPNPIISGIWPLGGLSLPHDLHAPLEQLGEPVPMDGANDIKHFGLNEDLGKEREASVLWSLPSSLA
jgi:hypothetical protein